MKKVKNLAVSCGALIGIALWGAPALSAQYLAIGPDDNLAYFTLAANPVIHLTSEGIEVASDDAAAESFAFSQIGKISFRQGEPPQSSLSPVDAGKGIVRRAEEFVFSGIDGSALAQVFSITGSLVLSAQVSDSMPLSVATLPQGIYILSVNNTRIKFVKK